MKNKKKKEKQEINSGVQKLITKDSTLTRIDSIDELWGVKTSKYREKTIEEYTRKLENFSNIELQNHAYEMGVSINLDKDVCIEKLINLFKSDLLSKRQNKNNIQVISNDTNEKLYELFGGKL